MWQLWHWLFGWHYIVLVSCAHRTIIRVRSTPSGNAYGYYLGRMFFIYPNGELSGEDYLVSWQPLTWKQGARTAELHSINGGKRNA